MCKENTDQNKLTYASNNSNVRYGSNQQKNYK